LSVSSYNSFSSLADETQGTPNPTDVSNLKQKPQKLFPKFKILSINCQSVVNKKHHLIKSQNPDIVTATESWLTKEHFNSDFFPADLGDTVFRRDRLKGKGGGIFILVKNNLLPTEQKNLNTDCEIIWIKIQVSGTKPLYIASYYKTK